MKGKDICTSVFIFFFVIFMGLFLSSKTGYYEEEAHNKTILTKEQIKVFEQDIKDGKEVDINNYLTANEKNYDNKISDGALYISNLVSNFIKNLLTSIVREMSKMIT